MPLLAATGVVIVVAQLIAYDGAPIALAVSAFGIAVAAVLILVALPRTDPAGHGLLALSFGVTAMFTTVAFWSAMPFAFAAGAIAARPRSVGAVLGLAASLLAFAFCVVA